MATTKLSPFSPVRPDDKRRAPSSSLILKLQENSAAEAYEQYLRLPELSVLWNNTRCPGWADEGLVKPTLQALETPFRFVSVALTDPHGYACRRQLARQLESLAALEVDLVAVLCEGSGQSSTPPLAELRASGGVLPRERSASEVWQLPGAPPPWCGSCSGAPPPWCATPARPACSRASLLEKSDTIAAKIKNAIESQMHSCAFSLSLGEPNLAGKPLLEYDRVMQPHKLHALTPRVVPEPNTRYCNRKNEALFTIHQILDCWIEDKDWEATTGDCWILERVWKLLADDKDLHLLMDPDDFLRLMRLYHGRRRGEGEDAGKIELLQAFQAVEGYLYF